MPTITEIFEIIAAEDQLAQGFFDTLDEYKNQEQQAIIEILERYLVSSLVDENGIIKPGALTDERLDEFEDELIGYFDYDNLNDFLERNLGVFQARLSTIDDLMIDLELTDGILGEDVFELPLVADEIDTVGRAMVEARNGTDDWEGSLERINKAFARYRLDRSEGRDVKLEDLKETLRKDAHVLPNYTNSIATTSLARMDRSLRRTQSLSADLQYGRYVGPLDDLTRPFCREQLEAPVKTWEEWDSMENNMTIELYRSPVSKVGGGINCRHRIVPWDPEWSEGASDRELLRIMAEAYRKVA